MNQKNAMGAKHTVMVVGALLSCAALATGCLAEADGPAPGQVAVDLQELGVSSVRRAASGEYQLLDGAGVSLGSISIASDASGSDLEATLRDQTATLTWSVHELSGGCGQRSTVLATREAATAPWSPAVVGDASELDACADVLTVATRIAEVEGIVMPVPAGHALPAPVADGPATEPPKEPLQCPGGSNWVWGGSCTRCLKGMKMIVGGSGEISVSCDPGAIWTECAWSSC